MRVWQHGEAAVEVDVRRVDFLFPFSFLPYFLLTRQTGGTTTTDTSKPYSLQTMGAFGKYPLKKLQIHPISIKLTTSRIHN